MVMAHGRRESLAAGDWTEAALRALAHGGLAAGAVEPLAKSLGTTKGSFYWHFADRNALLAAALERWEERDTDLVIATVARGPDAATRLRALLHLVFIAVGPGSGAAAGSVELALQADAGHPLVGPLLSLG